MSRLHVLRRVDARAHPPLCLLGIGLCLLFASLLSPVSADYSLHAERPSDLRGQFTYKNQTGLLYSEPSLFGLPNYHDALVGQLRMPGNDTYGCSDYPSDFLDLSDPLAPPVIALVSRDNCPFGTKALKAQLAGASGIIIYNTEGHVDYPLPKMAGGELTPQIAIPGMLIEIENGDRLVQAVQKWQHGDAGYKNGVWMGMSYSIVSTDGAVEYDFFTFPYEKKAEHFITQFAPVAKQITGKATFTPHYRLMSGDTHGCRPNPGSCAEADLPCGNQCTNCGRYCRMDPNLDPDVHPNGEDDVTEIAVAKCLYKWATEKKDPNRWWDYVLARIQPPLQCANIEDGWEGQECSKKAMEQIGMTQDQILKVYLCVGSTTIITNEDNPVLEDELKWQGEWQPLTSPYLFVNGFTYYGGFDCPDPIDVNTCGPLSIVCEAFNNKNRPDVCTPRTPENPPVQEESSFPIGTVIAVVIVIGIVIGGAVYWYMRRQNVQMREDIDNLLKQYLPMHDGARLTEPQKNGNHTALGLPSPSNRAGQTDEVSLIRNIDMGEPSEL